MAITGTRTKPAVDITITVTEIYVVPGSNQVTVSAISDDSDIKSLHRTVDIQDKVDALTDAKLDGINDLFRKLVAVGLGINESLISGEIFTKSS